ncbi:MAG: pantetheine-phosphate adenylyltransferase [Deltaproteobacteria bacterium]|nr:pantetheine-phosphate adenylyltransferase [Deltaproteobacteria bacterium]
MSRVAIYPGSFDPITNGHVWIIKRGLDVFDRLIVAIARNVKKTSLFDLAERQDLIRQALDGDSRVEIVSFDGLLVDYARKRGAHVILRGLRAVADFEYEFQMANMNRKLAPEVETIFMMTGEEYFYVSSALVKEVAALGGDVEDLVPKCVVGPLKRKAGAA